MSKVKTMERTEILFTTVELGLGFKSETSYIADCFHSEYIFPLRRIFDWDIWRETTIHLR